MATLHAAAVQQRRRRALHQPHATNRLWLQRTDLRFKVRQARIGICTLFVVDASGSMAARRRMALAKGAVLALLLSAYQKREQVALIAFRGTTADLLLPPTTSVDLASARLRELPTGGRTPLAQALRLAHLTLARQTRALERPVVPLLVLVSDGRANVSASGVDPQTDALAAATALHAAGVGALVVDAEEGRVRLGLARQIALALGGDYVRLPDTLPHPAGEQALADAVRARQRIERSTKR
jgi:magnesium chelatase subunit D